MNILVPVSVVPDPYTKVTIDHKNDSLNIPRTSLIINPLDVQVLSSVLSSPVEQRTITVVSVGEYDTEEALKLAYALGADKVVRIDTAPKDARTTACAIYRYMQGKKFDLVLCGSFSWDFASAQTPKRLSSITKLPLYEDVSSVECEGKEIKFSVQQEESTKKYIGTGSLILSCNKAIYPTSQVKIPSFRQMITARSKVIEVFDSKHLEAINIYHNFEYILRNTQVRIFAQRELPQLVDIILQTNNSASTDGFTGRKTIFSGTISSVVDGEWLEYSESSQGAILVEENKSEKHISLSNARVVISGGAGVSYSAWGLMDSIADKLKIPVGCSRPVYESGTRPYYQHVGQTGKIVCAELYIAVGISGALQHMAGVTGSKKILAINSDPNAEIFKSADYAVIGDAQKILSDILEIISKLPLPTKN